MKNVPSNYRWSGRAGNTLHHGHALVDLSERSDCRGGDYCAGKKPLAGLRVIPIGPRPAKQKGGDVFKSALEVGVCPEALVAASSRDRLPEQIH